jgi:hypothetical protein
MCDLGVVIGAILAELLFLSLSYAVDFKIDQKYVTMGCSASDKKLDSPAYYVADISQIPLVKQSVFHIVVIQTTFGRNKLELI